MATSNVTESDSPPPSTLVCASTRVSPAFRYWLSRPAAMPSFSTACMSAVLVSTQLCPITLRGSLPVCLRLTVNCLHDLLTSMAFLSNCIWSVPAMSTEHSAARTGALNAAIKAMPPNTCLNITSSINTLCDARPRIGQSLLYAPARAKGKERGSPVCAPSNNAAGPRHAAQPMLQPGE
ncbi:Uncharacterised protein [Bordetella pertussis]|nr:Uncharacterised protein [Bordetella pertussis]